MEPEKHRGNDHWRATNRSAVLARWGLGIKTLLTRFQIGGKREAPNAIGGSRVSRFGLLDRFHGKVRRCLNSQLNHLPFAQLGIPLEILRL